MKRVEKPTPFVRNKKCVCGCVMNFYVKHKLICNWCGRLAYYDEKEKFKDMMKKTMKNIEIKDKK